MVSRAKTRLFQSEYLGLDSASLRRSLALRLTYSLAKEQTAATVHDWFLALAYAVRDRLTDRWMDTQRVHEEMDAKQVYYLSLEFLIGRSLTNGLINLGILGVVRDVLTEAGISPEEVLEMECEAGLGNGGLGRLAACFLDSLATLNLPGCGYGIRYEYGIFTQRIDENGAQIEHPDNWLRYGNPWEFPRPEILYTVRFGGRVVEVRDEGDVPRSLWVDTHDVMAMAYDMPIPGFCGPTVGSLRLWSAKASRDFDLDYFNRGDYIRAVEEKNATENISRVLYPSDTTDVGRKLRLRQQYFFVSASLQDIIKIYQQRHTDFELLPERAAIQLNDTHPAIAVAELMRLLVDQYHLSWGRAWNITRRCFSYTNHTLLPEALETWPVATFEALLPRHLQIIYRINYWLLQEVTHHFPGDADLLARISLVDERNERRLRMAHLACVGSHHINGVAALHTELMRTTIFADFHRLYPERFLNITNGITPRRWLLLANSSLAVLVREAVGKCWATDLNLLTELRPRAEDAGFREEVRNVKRANKKTLANFIQRQVGITIDAESLFDVQIKRIHEYKRQLLNILHVVAQYRRLRADPGLEMVSRTVIFAGKAAPSYHLAKLTIHLINAVAEVVNHDPVVGGRLRVVFLPNYNVTLAEQIVPAAELSEQISTAGHEASGTGNMKLALNGALTIGTLDGANIEIRDAVGPDHFFLFGLTAAEVARLRRDGYNPWNFYEGELRAVLEMIAEGYFSVTDPGRFRPLVERLTVGGDPYLVLADYAAYAACQARVEAVYRDPEIWTKHAILNIAAMGPFSSDRAVQEYAQRVWKVTSVQIPQRGVGAATTNPERRGPSCRQ
ncbi:glycogen phosphorylase [Gammaproteobacteria bacterium]